MGLLGFGKKEIVYYSGCFSKAFLKPMQENYKKILKKLGIEAESLDSRGLGCCGGFLEEGGYEKEFRKIAKTNLNLFEENGTKKILTNCPLCYYTLNKYKDLIPNSDIIVEFVLNPIFQSLRENEKLVKNSFFEKIIYYDSCYLSRYLDFMELPRELLKLFGYEPIELKHNKKETLCCGSCGGLMHNDSDLADDIALIFIKKVLKLNVKKIVTADPRAYWHMKKNIQELGISQDRLQLMEFSEVICEALGLTKEE